MVGSVSISARLAILRALCRDSSWDGDAFIILSHKLKTVLSASESWFVRPVLKNPLTLPSGGAAPLAALVACLIAGSAPTLPLGLVRAPDQKGQPFREPVEDAAGEKFKPLLWHGHFLPNSICGYL